jgi:hypothetical protein
MYPPAKKGSLTVRTPCCTFSRARRRPACIPSCDIHHLECVTRDAMSIYLPARVQLHFHSEQKLKLPHPLRPNVELQGGGWRWGTWGEVEVPLHAPPAIQSRGGFCLTNLKTSQSFARLLVICCSSVSMAAGVDPCTASLAHGTTMLACDHSPHHARRDDVEPCSPPRPAG